MADETPIPAARLVFSPEDRRTIADLVDRALQTGQLTLGPVTKEFEAAFAAQHGGGLAVAMSSGSAALEAVLRSLEIEGRDVIVPTNTFFATAAAVVRAGGRPVLADVDAATLALSPSTIEDALTPQTAGVVLVHIGGLVTPAVDAIAELCRARGIFLFEDAAHAHGATYDGRSAGTFGQAAAFSFYPTKVLTAAEGGMVLTADPHIYDEMVIYRDQGKAGFFGGDHVRLGSAWRLSELHAAVGLVQVNRLAEFVATRRHIASFYDQALRDVPGVSVLSIPAECHSNYYKYIAMLDPGIDRDAVKQHTRDHGVQLTGEVYAKPLHDQPVFAELAGRAFPVADDVCGRHICLPVHSDMNEGEAARVVAALRAAIDAVPIEAGAR
jgi:perosamine synthetase